MTELVIRLKFDKYDLCRVKPFNKVGIAYPSVEWIGKDVLVIPVTYVISEKIIERNLEDDGYYYLQMETDTIIHKNVKNGKSVGRIYVPKELIGADVLIVDAPKIEYF